MSILTNKKRFLSRLFAGWMALILLPVVISCASGPGAYGGLGKPTDQVPPMAGVRMGMLPSGLRYFILENSKPENRAYLTLAVDAGSVLEEEDERGLAHFAEHMAFNGTVRFPEADLINYLRSLGMRFGADVNAYTSFDETVYGIEVPTEPGPDGRKGIPAAALAVIDDWTRAITFDPKDVDEERPIIMEEYRSRLGAMERIRRKILLVLFQGSQYAERLPIGLPEIIEAAPASRLEGFYKKWYRADNMAVIFVGDFDGAALEASLGEHFVIPAPDAPTARPRFDLPEPKKGNLEAAVLTDPELGFSQVYLYSKRQRELPRQDLAAYRQGLIDNLIDRMLSFRFQEDTADPASPHVYAGGGGVRYGLSSRFYILMAQTKTGTIEASLRALLREKESMEKIGFSAGELALAGRSLLSDLEQAASEKDRQESDDYIPALTALFLQGETVTDIDWELEAAGRLLPGISIRDINRAVKDYFSPGDIQIFILAPDSELENIPTPEKIRQIAGEISREKPRKRGGAALGAELLGRLPAGGTIVAEQKDPTGALIWELGNGARVILRETKNRNNEIILYAMARGGISSVPDAKALSALGAAEALNASGAGPYTRTELTKKLADKQISLSFWAGSYYRGFQGSATTADIKTLFELLYLGFTQPKIDPDAAAAMMDSYRTSLSRRNENPDAVFADEITRTMTGGHPRFKPLELADLSRMNTEDALDFLYLALNPADYTFVFTGNLDLKQIRAQVETYLASIPPADVSLNQWTDLGINRPGKLEKQVYKGQEERSQVYQAWYAPAPYTEEGSLAAQALEEYLDIKLTEEIREALGGVYSISPQVGLSSIPRDELSLSVYFVCEPRRADELGAAVAAQVGKIAAGDIDAGVFNKAREALIKSLESSIQRNAYLAQSYANSAVLLEAPLDRLDKRPALFRALKPADIQALAAQLQTGGPARITLYPEAKLDR